MERLLPSAENSQFCATAGHALPLSSKSSSGRNSSLRIRSTVSSLFSNGFSVSGIRMESVSIASLDAMPVSSVAVVFFFVCSSFLPQPPSPRQKISKRRKILFFIILHFLPNPQFCLHTHQAEFPPDTLAGAAAADMPAPPASLVSHSFSFPRMEFHPA